MLKRVIATVFAVALILGATSGIAHARTSAWDGYSTQRTSAWD